MEQSSELFFSTTFLMSLTLKSNLGIKCFTCSYQYFSCQLWFCKPTTVFCTFQHLRKFREQWSDAMYTRGPFMCVHFVFEACLWAAWAEDWCTLGGLSSGSWSSTSGSFPQTAAGRLLCRGALQAHLDQHGEFPKQLQHQCVYHYLGHYIKYDFLKYLNKS